MDKMIISSRFTPQRYDFQKNLQNFCDCFLEKSTPKAIFCDLYLTFRIVGQLSDTSKNPAGELPNILHPFISLWAARTSAGRQLGAGGHVYESRRAPTWKPAGTQMGAGVKIHISDYRYTVFER